MSEGQRKWSEVGDEEANQFRRDAARRVVAPAVALIVVGCLGMVANCLLAMTLTALRPERGPVARPAGMDDETFQAYERGRAAAPLLNCCLIAVPTLAVYPVVFIAGIRMQQLQTRWLALVGAILSMAPCSPVVLLGLPAGVWSLIVLADPEVQAAFADHRRRR